MQQVWRRRYRLVSSSDWCERVRVLLIEPDVVLKRAYGAGLRRAGHRVMSAVTAQQAVQAADRHRPDVVVLNLELARHNGVEFLYEFKSYAEWRNVPVVLLVPRQYHDLAGLAVLREQLGVQQTLVLSQTTVVELCSAVSLVGRRTTA